MQQISGQAARAVLNDPRFVVPPVPAATTGIAWLRATVGRFSIGEAHDRRRGLSIAILDSITPGSPRGGGREDPAVVLDAVLAGSPRGGGREDPAVALDAITPGSLRGGGREDPAVVLDAVAAGSLRVGGRERSAAVTPETLPGVGREHPVAVLARAMRIGAPVVDLVREVAQAYQPGTGDEARADVAVDRLVRTLGGSYDEPTAARIGVLVQACEATAVLIDRSRERPVEEVLRDDPPVPATKRQALVAVTVGGFTIGAGEVVRVLLAGDLAFGAGPRRCPGRAHALALAENAQARAGGAGDGHARAGGSGDDGARAGGAGSPARGTAVRERAVPGEAREKGSPA